MRFREGRFQDALEAFEAYESWARRNGVHKSLIAQAVLHQARCHLKLNQDNEACDDYHRVLHELTLLVASPPASFADMLMELAEHCRPHQ